MKKNEMRFKEDEPSDEGKGDAKDDKKDAPPHMLNYYKKNY